MQNSNKECKVCERRRAQSAVQIMAPLLKRAFAKFCVDYAGPLITKITQRLSAKKISVPYYLLSKQSGTDFLNASSRMVATRGAEEDRTKSHVIMTQTS